MGNDLNALTAKELKVIAEEMGLVKGEDFKANASKDDMLKLIESQNNDDSSDNSTEGADNTSTTLEDDNISEGTGEDNNSEYTVVTPVKRNGKILVKGESIEFFEGIESLIEDGIIKKS